MRELRRDPITGRWVVFADARRGRPREFAPARAPRLALTCPFCPGNEGETPPEVLAVGRGAGSADAPGWRVRVVPNKYPALSTLETPPASPPGDRLDGYGAHEIVVESPEHDVGWEDSDPAGLAEMWRVCRDRMGALGSLPGIRHVVAFKNHGEAAGATLVHPHLQVVALPLVPPGVEVELAGSSRANGSCPFCSVLERETAGGERIVSDRGAFVALAPFAPRFPYETWIVPRAHAPRFEEASDALLADFAGACRDAASRIARHLDRPAYNAILHTAPVGDTRPYHWHLEVLPRTVHAAGFEWGTGLHMNPVFPEEAARALRGAVHAA